MKVRQNKRRSAISQAASLAHGGLAVWVDSFAGGAPDGSNSPYPIILYQAHEEVWRNAKNRDV